jgi:hypothetical protein
VVEVEKTRMMSWKEESLVLSQEQKRQKGFSWIEHEDKGSSVSLEKARWILT